VLALLGLSRQLAVVKFGTILVVGTVCLVAGSACGDSESDGGSGARAGAGNGGTGGSGGKNGASAGSAGKGSAGNAGSTSGNAGSGTGGTTDGGNAGTGTGGSVSGSTSDAGEGGDPAAVGGEGGARGGEGGRVAGSGGTGGIGPGDAGAAGDTQGGSPATGGAAGESGAAPAAGGAAGSGGSGGSETVVSVTAAARGDLVVSEIMCNGYGPVDDLGRWFELHNTTATALDLQGLTLSSDLTEYTIDSSWIVPAQGYVVFAQFAGGAASGVTRDHSLALSIDDERDFIRLEVPGEQGLPRVLDQMSYFENSPHFPAASLSLVGPPGSIGSVCAAGTRYGTGRLGTPGSANGRCLVFREFLAPGDLVISEFMTIMSEPVGPWGEWLELFNPGPHTVNLSALTISTSSLSLQIRSDGLFLDPGDYAVLGPTNDPRAGYEVDYEYQGLLYFQVPADTIGVSFDDEVIDEVSYDAGFPFATDVSASLAPGETAITNDSAASWCAGSSTFEAELPFVSGRGTPGFANDACP
jgi:hypothetical protein